MRELEIGNIVRIDHNSDPWFRLHFRELDGAIAEVVRLEDGNKDGVFTQNAYCSLKEVETDERIPTFIPIENCIYICENISKFKDDVMGWYRCNNKIYRSIDAENKNDSQRS